MVAWFLRFAGSRSYSTLLQADKDLVTYVEWVELDQIGENNSSGPFITCSTYLYKVTCDLDHPLEGLIFLSMPFSPSSL